MFLLRKLLPQTADYDFNVHVMDFLPGEFLNVKVRSNLLSSSCIGPLLRVCMTYGVFHQKVLLLLPCARNQLYGLISKCHMLDGDCSRILVAWRPG